MGDGRGFTLADIKIGRPGSAGDAATPSGQDERLNGVFNAERVKTGVGDITADIDSGGSFRRWFTGQ